MSNECYVPDGDCLFINDDGSCGHKIVGPCSHLIDPKKWWLISDKDVQTIKKGLTGDLLHTLESGLHKTDEIPEDWK